jgi:hypothetical protein
VAVSAEHRSSQARPRDQAREQLVDAARKAGIDLRQSYARLGKAAKHQVGRYAEPGLKLSSGQFVPGEQLGRWPNAACKAMPGSTVACDA